MAYIVKPEVVNYACLCGLLKPISRLYFCRHCLQLRCGYCVCHEVDTLFCGRCSENLPSTEARLKRNKCSNCVMCPSCHQQLSTRGATAAPKNPQDPKASPSKVIYLICLSCRWSTRDVGIPDQSVDNEKPAGTAGPYLQTGIFGDNSWPERENVNANRLHEIQERYKGMVLFDKLQKMDKDKKKQRKYMSLTERTGITTSMIRKRLGLPDSPSPLLKSKPKIPIPATALEEVEPLPEQLLTRPIKLTDITTIQQRLMLPDGQPTTVDKLHTIHKHLLVKRSLRCRSCEHNVVKPEYNPNSVKFKIQLFAYYHIPEIRIFTVEPLRAGKKCELLLKFINPTQHQTVIKLLPLDYEEEKPAEEPATAESLPVMESKEPTSLSSLSQPSSLIHTSLTRQPSLTVKPRQIDVTIGGEIAIPDGSFKLPPRDDAAEYDDTGDNHNFRDDPELVVHRKSNKAVIKLHVTPKELNLGDDVVIGFTMQHLYTNTIVTTIENKEPQKCDHRMKVFLNLGKLVGSE